MKDSINIEGREFISVARASEITKYTKDYVGQLCRSGKVDARMIGRVWFVDRQSLVAYKSTAETFYDGYGKQKNMVVPAIVIASTPSTELSYNSSFGSKVNTVSTVVAQNTIVTESKNDDVTYVRDERSLLPELNKNIITQSAANSSHLPVHNKIVCAPIVSRIQIPSEQISDTLTRIKNRTHNVAPENLRGMRSTVFAVMVSVVVISASATMFLAFSKSEKNSGQLALGAPVENTASVAGFFGSIGDFIKNIFNNKSKTLATNTGSSPPEYQGIVIAPSSGISSKDELIKQNIQRSFSDEVHIQIDEGGTTGVITPVFKRGTGENFMYVMVPVQDSNKNQ